MARGADPGFDHAIVGDDVVDQIERRLDDSDWWFGPDGGRLDKPDDLPQAHAFLTRGGDRERNQLVVYIRQSTAGTARGGRGPSVQVVTSDIEIAFLLPARDDPGGKRAQNRAKSWKRAVRQRLLAKGGDVPDRHAGWQPKGAAAPLRWLGGRLEPFREDHPYIIWIERFQVEWVLDSQRFSGS